jgi:16S rRNA (cytidine1402-2'-O)-methyltransferase
MAALAVSGLPTDTFTFLGFPPTRASARSRWFDQVRAAGRTVVFFEAPHRIRQTLEDLVRSVGDVQVAVGRELTKAHEELIRGSASSVLKTLSTPRGEFTVVADVGQLPESEAQTAPADRDIGNAFGELTNSGRFTRRGAITELARRFRLPAREVYAAIERTRNLVK